MDAAESEQIQLSFVTKDPRYSVSTHPVYVQLDSSRSDLSDLVKSLLTRDNDSGLEFEFVVQEELLVGSLRQLVQDRSLSLDSVLSAEFFVRRSAPRPHSQLAADDFVSCVRANGRQLLAAVYDGTVQLATVDSSKATATVEAHAREVKCVDWLPRPSGNDADDDADDAPVFVSGGHDQDCRLWRWAAEADGDCGSRRAVCSAVCKGHADSVLCLAACPDGQRFASGSYDGQIKVWAVRTDLTAETGGIRHQRTRRRVGDGDGDANGADEEAQEEEAAASAATRLPQLTLAGHKDAVHSVHFCDTRLLCSGSSDASLRLWDCEAAAEASSLRTSAAVLDLHARPQPAVGQQSRPLLLLAGCASQQPRLFDPRSDTDVLVASFAGHDSWVSAVRWCPTAEQLFVTAGYDTLLKVWDLRCWRAPLYDIRDHTGVVASVDWTTSGHIVSAGADQTVKVFSAELAAA